jgi:hypothetical protein
VLVAAEQYAYLRNSARVREPSLFRATRTLSEIELQARWFAGDFGKRFQSTAGEEIEIVQFGVWNRESGPDFVDAAISLDRKEPRRGSIEFDLAANSWEAHGHAMNPAFSDVILHVVTSLSSTEFFTRTMTHRNVPQVLVDPAVLPDVQRSNVPLAHAGRCQAPLRDLPPERVETILDAAAQFRLRQKASRLWRIGEAHGAEQAFYQELASALGYKQNKLPFTLLAQRVPLRLLQENAGAIEPLLFGVAGFLNKADLGGYYGAARYSSGAVEIRRRKAG